MWYVLGRWNGQKLIRTAPFLRKVRAHATLFLRRWGRLAAFLMRFAYGLRTVLPASIGAAHFPWVLFIPFNLLGSVAFAGVYLSLGYFFGEALEAVLETVSGLEWWILLGIGGLGLIIWTIRDWKLLHTAAEPEQEEAAEPEQEETAEPEREEV